MIYTTTDMGSKDTRNELGRRHSYDDKPSYISRTGYMSWRKNGRLHRLTGPAIVDKNNNDNGRS